MFRNPFHLWLATGLPSWVIGQAPPSIDTGRCNVPLTASAVLNGNSGTTGQVHFRLVPGTQLLVVDVTLAGLRKPPGFGDYTYHVHTHPVGADGNCEATRGHLDPFNVGKAYCSLDQPQLCELGDLSGKFGKISSDQDTANVHYIEPFLRFSPPEQSILGRSIVLHAPDSTRLACGNITSWLDNTADLSGNPTLQASTFAERSISSAQNIGFQEISNWQGEKEQSCILP